MVAPYQKTLSLSLAAAVANGVCLSQSGTAGTPLTIAGSLASGGIATFDNPRRVGVTSAGNDSANSFTIVGTDYYGRTQTEVLTGANAGVAQTVRDFATVTAVTPTSNTASTVTVGTTSVGSTPPAVLDAIANPTNVTLAGVVNGTVTYTVEVSYDDLYPAFNVNSTPPTYFNSGIASATGNLAVTLNAPTNLVRLTINSGVGTASVRILQNFLAGRI